VTVGIYVVDDITIGFRQITSRRHGKGYGSECLDWLVGLADKYSVGITGWVQANGDEHLTFGQLKAWYSKRGFTVEDGDWACRMERKAA
jgi:GNAT superfamily N-acetyltransferase